ncbi:unnamed protein product [Clonostachys chloroleuca]|uniref:Zn(2)-C6 fungal-type domain-containing protein n=1 Tax=Clonostachys chloroleuca TaxID=1926264 RepID=A0AA35M1W8_9HYPO|nr:unnamed protein product [Clonostachys chloroleuca]
MSDQPRRPRRRKVTLACEPCRERKARCDGVKPLCSTCRRRALGIEQCIYKVDNARTACIDDYTKSLHERIRVLEDTCSRHGIDPESGSTADNVESGPSESQANLDALVMGTSQAHILTPLSSAATEGIETSSKATHVTAMGASTSEEESRDATQTYFGSSSAASFLRQTCGTMNPPLSRQTSGIPQPSPPQLLSPYSGWEKLVLPPRNLADHLVQRYFERVFYLYPIFDRDAFESAYQSLWTPGGQYQDHLDSSLDIGLGGRGGGATTIAFHSSLNCIFALGSAVSDLSTSAKLTAYDVFFSRSKQNIGLDLVDMNNISVVQTMLLVALTLQGTPFPDRCWNAVGMACRIAQSLGLHSMPKFDPQESRVWKIRRRTWHGCIVLDTVVSMNFGRPTMLTSLSSLVVPPPVEFDPEACEDMKMQFQSENVRLSIILEKILSNVYQPWQSTVFHDHHPAAQPDMACQSMDTFVDLDGRLSAFERSVPEFLAWKAVAAMQFRTEDAGKLFVMQRNILHARFIYVRLMLYRPILTRLLASEISGESNNSLQASFNRDGARACVNSAISLITLVRDTFSTDHTGAWWWNALYACTASLVLITCRLCPSLWATPDQSDIITSWEKCNIVLESISSFSPFIRKSFDLLLKINQIVITRQTSHVNEHPINDLGTDLLDTMLEGDFSLHDALNITFPFDMDISQTTWE